MHFLNRLVVLTLPFIPKPIVRFFAGRYIAGETIQHAIQTVRQLNGEGVGATIDVLGEDVFTREETVVSRDQSIEVLHAIAREKLDSNLSIKLTSLGLKVDKDLCAENVREILRVASGYGIFVRIDMEDSSCTTETLAVYTALRREFPHCGIVVQAYLFRTQADVRELMKQKTNFRLCKGIYKERREIAFQTREDVQQNYIRLLEMMLRGGSYVGIATHDSVLVDAASRIVTEMGLRKDQYEFQMLLGVRPELRKKLVREGRRVRLYVPFGEHWYGYSLRRFKENPEIAGYVFKALFKHNH